MNRPDSKIFTLAKLSGICQLLRNRNETIVLTHGCFDLVHSGHVEYLLDAATYGTLIVGINSDASVRALKGESRPVRAQDDRAFVIASMYPVAYTSIFDNDIDIIQVVKPDVYIASKTSNVLLAEDNERVELLKKIGAKVFELDSKRPDISTTKIIEKSVA